MDRRSFLNASAILGSQQLILPSLSFAQAPYVISREKMRPQFPSGIQSGDPTTDSAIIWARSDRSARMWVEWSTTSNFANARRVRGNFLLENTDFTGRLDLTQLPQGQDIFYRVILQDLHNERVFSEAMNGHLRLPQSSIGKALRDVRFTWSGDTVGQGFGINESWGGMRIYEEIRKLNPDFFLHSGDNIYADGPINEEIKLPDGSVWNNLVTEEVSKVAETLNEFRGRYRYNFMDTNLRRMAADVPQIWQWDDHEVMNNYSDSKDISDDKRYTEKSIPLMVARATKAFHEFAPMREFGNTEAERVYRYIQHGPLMDLFVLDMRSYRGPNSTNLQSIENEESAFMGRPQVSWLIDGLIKSKATWKVIAADMPIGLQVPDGKTLDGQIKWEAIANGDHGQAKGREIEISRLLSAIKKANIHNIVWLTADVHYTAAHFYDPSHARFSDFKPFWEFVSGPLNAGGFGPNLTDNTFGLQVIYQKAPAVQNAAPSTGMQFFGQVDIDAKTHAMTVTLKDLYGAALYHKTLAPVRG